MQISTNWVNDYVNIKDENLKELADKITKAGVNIEKIESHNISNLVVAKVLECINHPDSDHLHVCKVTDGVDTYQVVCGAPNVRAGLVVILAKVGAVLPGNFEIKPSKIRGVESYGMLCALFELGLEEKTEETYSKGICELPEDATLGQNAIEYLGADDTVYHLDLNPNRNDCLSHLGFAYEVAAVTGKNLIMPDVSYIECEDKIEDIAELAVETENCPMFNLKAVKDIVIKPSPEFIQNRLINAGMRPINNVVDISNYIMLEYGQPLHFYDADKMAGKVVVKMASPEDGIVTLDDTMHKLCSEDIVIKNGNGEVACVAGVMGAKSTEITENTKTVLIESAIFNPYNVRYSSIRHSLRTEAAVRIEKGLNYEYTMLAVDRACHLLEKYAEAKVIRGTLRVDNVDKTPKVAQISRGRINEILGMELSCEDIETSFNSLQFEYKKMDDENYEVVIPNRRMDVSIPVDLVEEVGRLYGYDNITPRLPVSVSKEGGYVGAVALRKYISKFLRSLSLNETRTYTLISDKEASIVDYDNHEEIKLLKPMSVDRSVVRQSLIPSMINTIEYNKSRKVEDINIYEIANVYYNKNEEETKICFAMSGKYIQNAWNKSKIDVDFFLCKGVVESLLEMLGFDGKYSFVKTQTKGFHPGICANILLYNEPIGVIGKLHPNVTKYDVYTCELSFTKIEQFLNRTKAIKYIEPAKYPSVVKDMAFVLDNTVENGEVEKVIKSSVKDILSKITLFDVYQGENLEPGKKSMAYSFTFIDKTKTLTDDEVNAALNKIEENVKQKLGGIVRR